jgi:hypothetical protein
MRFLLLVLTYLHLSAANASGYFTGPISSAMGGTGRAGINSAEGSFLNPATIPLIKNYEAIAYYRDGYIGERQHRQTLALGAADNSEGVLFPGALHYLRTRDTGRSGDPANGEIWHASGAYLITDRLSVGATVFHSVYGIDGLPEYKQWGASLGAIVLIHDELSFAYVLENIGKPGSDMPVALREDLTHAIGSFWRFATLATLRLDVTRIQNDDLNPDGKMTYMAGVESAFSEFGVFRVGFRREELTDLKIWTAGMGFNGPRLRFDYAMEKNEEGTSGALHSVDMRIPF